MEIRFTFKVVGIICLLLLFAESEAFAVNAKTQAPVWVSPTLSGSVGIRSWRAQRDEGLVRQRFEKSCGAASLASVLSKHYGMNNVSEARILGMLPLDGVTTFLDLSTAAEALGFSSRGFQLTPGQLRELRVPGIAYLEIRGYKHFVVVEHVSRSGVVFVADPASGRQRYLWEQFLKLWQTAKNGEGKVLIVIPKERKRPQGEHYESLPALTYRLRQFNRGL